VQKKKGESAKNMEPRGVVEGFDWQRDECGMLIGENIHDQSRSVDKACKPWKNYDDSKPKNQYDIWHGCNSKAKKLKDILE